MVGHHDVVKDLENDVDACGIPTMIGVFGVKVTQCFDFGSIKVSAILRFLNIPTCQGQKWSFSC